MQNDPRANPANPRAAGGLRGYGRWLRVWAGALLRAARGELAPDSLLWTADEGSALLAAGFPSLLAVPEELFAQTAALFPDRLRLCAAGRGEEELLAAIRGIEQRCGARFDWDRFLARCERENRRAQRLASLAEALRSLVPPPIDARTPHSALRDLAEYGF